MDVGGVCSSWVEQWRVSRPYSMPTRHSRLREIPGKYYFTNL